MFQLFNKTGIVYRQEVTTENLNLKDEGGLAKWNCSTCGMLR